MVFARQASTDCRVEPMVEVLHQAAKTIERLMFFDADTSIATPGGVKLGTSPSFPNKSSDLVLVCRQFSRSRESLTVGLEAAAPSTHCHNCQVARRAQPEKLISRLWKARNSLCSGGPSFLCIPQRISHCYAAMSMMVHGQFKSDF